MWLEIDVSEILERCCIAELAESSWKANFFESISGRRMSHQFRNNLGDVGGGRKSSYPD